MYIKRNKLGKLVNARSRKINKKRSTKGIVYILKCLVGPLDNQRVVYKIGYTARGSLDMRLGEIVLSLFRVYGYIPQIEPIRRETTQYFTEIESYMHSIFKSDRFSMDERVSGYTEFFSLDKDKVCQAYDRTMAKPLDYIKSSSVVSSTIPTLGINDIQPVLSI